MTQHTALLPLTSLLASLLAGCAPQLPNHAAMSGHAGMGHAAHMQAMASPQRQTEVAGRGGDVMPFSLSATVHVFDKTPAGGTQRVLARNADDATQVALVRQHLREIRGQFLKGDFSGPGHIHGQDMPGLAQLTTAQPGQLDIAYNDVAGGAELVYTTAATPLVGALHRWFDAQLADHGKDAVGGHAAGHSGPVGAARH